MIYLREYFARVLRSIVNSVGFLNTEHKCMKIKVHEVFMSVLPVETILIEIIICNAESEGSWGNIVAIGWCCTVFIHLERTALARESLAFWSICSYAAISACTRSHHLTISSYKQSAFTRIYHLLLSIIYCNTSFEGLFPHPLPTK